MPWRLLTALSALALLVTLGFAGVALEGIPHVLDEQAYLLQARVFAGGARMAPSPVDGVAIVNVYQRILPGWHGLFPPGWSYVLALGAALGLPWAVNPLLSAALPWLAWWAFSPHLPPRAARLSAGLAALSPGILVLGGSMMSHTLALACGLAALAAAGASELKVPTALAGGAALGLLLLTRPYDAALVGLPLCAWVAWRGRAEGLATVAAFALGPALALGLTVENNLALTGSWSTFPISDYHARPTDWGQRYPPGCDALGFGADRGCLGAVAPGHSLADGWGNLVDNARRYDRLFMGFPGSSLAALMGLVLLARRRGWLAVPALTVPLGYAAYWYHGVVYGARFWTCLGLATLPAAALAIDAAVERLGLRGGRGVVARWALPLFGLVMSAPPLWMELSDDYWCSDADRAALVEAAGVREGVVIVQDSGQRPARWPLTTLPEARVCTPALSQAAALGWNDPYGAAPITWIEATGPLPDSASAAAARHPGEAVYVLARSLETGAWRLGRWQDGALVELARGP